MSAIEGLREKIPEPAKDIRLNLQSVLESAVLSPAQRFGVALAAAAVSKNAELKKAVFEEAGKGDAAQKVFKEFRQVSPGRMSPAEFDRFVRDTVNFLAYIGEPMQLERQRLGVWVLAFLLLFGILAYLLKQEIWKDVK